VNPQDSGRISNTQTSSLINATHQIERVDGRKGEIKKGEGKPEIIQLGDEICFYKRQSFIIGARAGM